jgi:hypothetical protein
MLTPSRLSLVAICSLVLALPGCGSSGGGADQPLSKADYEKQVKKLGEDFRSQVTATQGKVSSATDTKSRLTALDEFKQEFTSFATKIDAINPPSGSKDEQDAVVASFKKGADDIGKVEDAVRTKNKAAIKSSAAQFQTDASSVQGALQKLRDAVTK